MTWFWILLLVVSMAVGLAGQAGRMPLPGGHSVEPGDGTESAPDQTEVAYLAGGPDRAALAAVATLRESGVIGSSLDPLRAPRADERADPLVDAVHRALRESTTLDGRDLVRRCLPQLTRIRADLDRRGLLGRRRPAAYRYGWGLMPLYVVLAFLVVTGLGGPTGERLTGSLGPGVFSIGAVILYALLTLVRRWTGFGSRTRSPLLARWRSEHAHLAPAYRPSHEAYGPGSLGLAAALFGLPALELVDRELAATPTALALGTGGTDSGADMYAGDGGACGTFGEACAASFVSSHLEDLSWGSGPDGGGGSGSCASALGGCGGSSDGGGGSCGGGGCGGCGGGGS